MAKNPNLNKMKGGGGEGGGKKLVNIFDKLTKNLNLIFFFFFFGGGGGAAGRRIFDNESKSVKTKGKFSAAVWGLGKGK